MALGRPAPARRAAAAAAKPQIKTTTLTERTCAPSDQGDHAYGEVGQVKVEIPLFKTKLDKDGKPDGKESAGSKIFFVDADTAKNTF